MKLWKYLSNRMLSHPEQTVREGGASMTYEELCVFAEQFAKKLNQPCYGILCRSELAAAMALLSCIAAGKPAVPLPYRYGKEVYMKILDRADPACIITDLGGELGLLPMEPRSNQILTDFPAVILFTSGSTGEPKGVMLSEENLLSNLQGICSYLPLTTSDRFLISRPLYHSSVLTGEFLTSLCQGSHILFHPEPFQPGELLKLIRRDAVTALGSTPTLLSTLARFARHGATDSVRVLSVSGECMSEGAAEQIRLGFPNADVYCGYGLSEASPRVAYLPPKAFAFAPTAAGIPLPSVELRIVDESGHELPAGEVGELLVRGDNVMLGYFRDAEKTRQVLQNGWLHTGDLACICHDKMLYIKGRKDDMIIRAGMNIYPAEIENALSSDPRVTGVSVSGYTDDTTQQIALKICGSFAAIEEVSALCRQKLPPHQMPATIELLKELPHAVSGKKKR